MTFVVDNVTRRLGEALRARIAPGARLSIVSAYFTIYAWSDLRRELEEAGDVRFLYGDPRGVGAPDPAEAEGRAFRLTEDGGLDPARTLEQRPLARACAEWIRTKAEVRTVRRANFLHGKMYHAAPARGAASAAFAGSSNFTRRGLGFGAAPNIELNIEIGREDDRAALRAWFDGLWSDDARTEDAKQEVLAALERLGRAYAPEFVYYKTLFHVFAERLADRETEEAQLRGVHLYDTEIWRRLYDFQRAGAKSVIARLLRHGGCILADSVGLGKTWTALAAIEFFETRNERVLVLCPKRLEYNWVRYTARAAQRGNPFMKDRFDYTVLAHTDLSRDSGMAGGVDLARFNWGAFDLVVIDESHNFRNEGRDREDEAGRVVRRSRYNRLLEEVVKDGARTKVLMLSATPVNTSLRDLRNQIYLMTEKRRDAFRDSLGVGDVQSVFGVAQREFLAWENRRREGGKADKAELFGKLGADFLALLDAVTIARSRDHLRRFHAEETEKFGGFPERARPVNLHPPTDSEGAVSYDDLHDRIGEFRLSLYRPSDYLRDTAELAAEKAERGFDQRDRERFLVGMMRTNLLKRLESSAHAFRLTAERVLAKIDALESRMDAWRDQGGGGEVDARPEDDVEDDEFAVGRAVRYRFAELDVDRWRADLEADREIFADLRDRAQRVTPERDAKLAALLELLADKAANPTRDKDGRENRKALVFTAFADTARYLYDNVIAADPGVRAALVTGAGAAANAAGPADFAGVLARFAPRAQEAKDGGGEEIDVLIATDCLSEGQNLQDCDLAVNYDIHWNPVRLMQRFGRIDRLGGRSARVRMANFWPTQDLDRYLDLKTRVEARMALADAAATGRDDLLDADAEDAARAELTFRDEQLLRLRDEVFDIEEADDGVAMSDFTLEDFIAELLRYIEANRKALEDAPLGIHAVADPAWADREDARPGAIFCLKQKEKAAGTTPNRLNPYFLVYVRADGTVRYGFRQAAQCLSLFRALAAGRGDPSMALEDAFDRATDRGRRMDGYGAMLRAALRDIPAALQRAERERLGTDRGALLTKRSERPAGAENFELATWLAIMEEA